MNITNSEHIELLCDGPGWKAVENLERCIIGMDSGDVDMALALLRGIRKLGSRGVLGEEKSHMLADEVLLRYIDNEEVSRLHAEAEDAPRWA